MEEKTKIVPAGTEEIKVKPKFYQSMWNKIAGEITTPTVTPIVTAEQITEVKKHQVDINLKFQGQPPQGVDSRYLKDVIRTEIGKAVRSTF